MKKLSGQQIRETWIKFFESKGHKWLPGVGLIPQGDKSLLWVNAGVTGLKKYFDGSEVPPCRRIVNVQKSIRTNDIENVGHTARHHTFFEMLGNFSIGDYFRKEAIEWAFEILTNEEHGFGMDKDKLYMTYNPSDKDSFELWQKQGVDSSHLIPLEGNYWQIGEGPCGPNTEVFYDRGEQWDPEHLGVKLLSDDIENDRYIELWGIVFSQYNAVNGVAREDYEELPSKNIDTGSGLERIACILQGTDTNFETDLFMPIIEATEKISGVKYEAPNLMPFRVIADHARCLTFALSDGATFSNEGRGYVLRRIIRRAMRYGQKIGIKKPFMHELIQIVADKYHDFYPELEGKVANVSSMVLTEEKKFLKTLIAGEELLHKMIEGKKELGGLEAFRLYDTFGFPLDITKEIASEEGVKVDEEGFNKLMEEQRERARNARGEIESFHKQSKDLMDFKDPSEFLYHTYEWDGKAIGLFVEGERVEEISDSGEVIFDKTPFYAEMGGQVADKGIILGKDFEAEVISVGKATNGQHLHVINVIRGSLHEGDILTLKVDFMRRSAIEKNHSATHLMHAALSKVLGEHIEQKGSYVDDEYLRFDFGFDRKLSDKELQQIEDEVNSKINERIEEKTLILPIEEAKKIGAEMEFSEKYGDTVRVVTFGEYSKEFCGGTHVSNSMDIGIFALESEMAISSGTRRIQAVSGYGAYQYLRKKESLLQKGESLFASSDVDFLSRAESYLKENASLKKENAILKEKISSFEAKSIDSKVIGGIDFFAVCKEGVNRDDLLTLGDQLKANKKDYIVILLGGEEGKRPLLVLVGGAGLEKWKAGDLIRKVAVKLGGNGGGRDMMASGQVRTKEGFEKAIEEIEKELK